MLTRKLIIHRKDGKSNGKVEQYLITLPKSLVDMLSWGQNNPKDTTIGFSVGKDNTLILAEVKEAPAQ